MTGPNEVAGLNERDTGKEIVRRLYEDLFSHGQLDVVDQIMTEDYVNHDPPSGHGSTRDDLVATAASLRERLEDLTARIDRIIAEDDLVAVQGIITATTSTGELTEIPMSEFFRLKDGRIAERWG